MTTPDLPARVAAITAARVQYLALWDQVSAARASLSRLEAQYADAVSAYQDVALADMAAWHASWSR